MGLFDRLASVLRRPDRASAELDYLNQATSRIDLEMREREIDRGRFRHLPRR
jgi:CRISPR/Cas system-associated protein Csm6